MTIGELITNLKRIKAEEGNLQVGYQNFDCDCCMSIEGVEVRDAKPYSGRDGTRIRGDDHLELGPRFVEIR